MTTGKSQLHEFNLTIRFVRGYRFLDRTGEALVRLEDTLENGWIPAEISPSNGTMTNYALGMRAQFDSESIAIIQREYLDIELFWDQACKFYDILRNTYQVSVINTPTLRVVRQIGFETADEAEAELMRIDLFTPSNNVLEALGGARRSSSVVLCTEQDCERLGITVHERRRLEAKVLLQQRHETYDERLVRRASLLPNRQREALMGLLKLRSKTPAISPTAVQIILDDSLEGEITATDFSMVDFIKESWAWNERAARSIIG